MCVCVCVCVFVCSCLSMCARVTLERSFRMCSLIECVLFLQNVYSYYRMCPLTIECECVLLLQNVFSYYRSVYSYDRMVPRVIEYVRL